MFSYINIHITFLPLKDIYLNRNFRLGEVITRIKTKTNMSSFSDSNLAKKLNELNGTQQSIQTLSLWLIHHRKHSKTIVQVWLRELKKGK
jgi:regulator of Ty1 transposition protein 103